jgi:hypothetical protein
MYAISFPTECAALFGALGEAAGLVTADGLL